MALAQERRSTDETPEPAPAFAKVALAAIRDEMTLPYLAQQFVLLF
jgi:hypothetical protein